MKIFRIILIFFLLITPFIAALAQWNPLTNIPKQNYYSITTNGPAIYIGGSSYILKSLNNGVTWDSLPIHDALGNSMAFSKVSSIYAQNDQIVYLAGFALLANSAIILKSTNGGQSWAISDFSNEGIWPRTTNVVKSNGEVVIAAGNNGYLRTSNNNGETWQQVNINNTNNFNDIVFSTSGNCFIAGNGIITKYNYISNIIQTSSFTGVNLNTICFADLLTGYAAGDNSTLLKTTDGGITWNKIPFNAPLTVNFQKIHFTNSDTGFLIGDQYLFKTTDGGVNWEKLTFKQTLHDITFQDQQNGILCGEAGILYRSNTPIQGFSPICSFTVSPQIFCNDSIIKLNNLSNPSNTFQWQLNGKTFSTVHTPLLTINNPGQTDTLSLIASNGVKSDTMTVKLYIQPSLNVDLSSAYLQHDSVCRTQKNEVMIPRSVNGAIYNLYRTNGQLLDSKSSYGGIVTLTTDQVMDMTTYILKASLTIAGCGTGTKSKDFIVQLTNPDPTIDVTTGTPVSCIYTNSQLIIPKPESAVVYQLRKEYTNVGLPIKGNGMPIIFTIGYLSDSATQYNIVATRGQSCVSILARVPAILVENTQAYFSVNSYNLMPGEPLKIVNNSVNAATYQWTFSGVYDGVSQTFQPVDITLPAGKETIGVVAQGTHGCRDTLIREVNSLAKLPSDECAGTQIATGDYGWGGYPYAVANDLEGNTYFYCGMDNALTIKSFNEYTDTLKTGYSYTNDHRYGLYVVKVNKYGIPQWILPTRFSNPWSSEGNIDVDSLGNIYIQYQYYDDYLPIHVYSVDGSLHSIKPDKFRQDLAVVLAKYDKNGNFLWLSSFGDSYTTSSRKNSIKVDGKGNVYVGSERGFQKFDVNGKNIFGNLNTSPYHNGISDIEIGSDGNVYLLNEDYLTIQKYSPEGTFLWESQSIVKTSDHTYLEASGLELDLEGNMYISGNFRGKFLFNNDTISDPYVGGNLHDGAFIAKLDKTGKQLWLRQLKSNGGTICAKGFALKGDQGYFLAMLQGYSAAHQVELVGRGTLNYENPGGYFMVHFNKNGSISDYRNLQRPDDYIRSESTIPRAMLSISPLTNKPTFVMSLGSSMKYGNNEINLINKNYNYYVFQGELDCFQSSLVTDFTDETMLLQDLQIYPNPSTGEFNLQFSNPTNKPWKVIVLSPLGKVVHQMDCFGAHTEMHLATLVSAGLYYVEILMDGQKLVRKLEIIEK